jgi:hypothetical protein
VDPAAFGLIFYIVYSILEDNGDSAVPHSIFLFFCLDP